MAGLGFEPSFTYSKSQDPKFWEGKLEEYSPPWMKSISLPRKTNFYEGQVGNYTMISQKKTESMDAAFGDVDDRVDL